MDGGRQIYLHYLKSNILLPSSFFDGILLPYHIVILYLEHWYIIIYNRSRSKVTENSERFVENIGWEKLKFGIACHISFLSYFPIIIIFDGWKVKKDIFSKYLSDSSSLSQFWKAPWDGINSSLAYLVIYRLCALF